MVITKFDTKLGDIFITKFDDHQIYHKIKHKFLWKFGQQFVDFIQWHISHRIFWSPNLSPYFAPNLMFTQIGDQFITKFGDKIGDHQIWHLIRWQICHRIWWTPNMSPNNSPNLVTTLSPKRVLTDFVTKFVTIFCTKFGNHRICHRIWWQIWCRICHQKTLGSYLISGYPGPKLLRFMSLPCWSRGCYNLEANWQGLHQCMWNSWTQCNLMKLIESETSETDKSIMIFTDYQHSSIIFCSLQNKLHPLQLRLPVVLKSWLISN